MYVYTEPRVTVVSFPTFLEPKHLRCEWEGSADPAARLVEYAGRVCYMSQANPAKRTTRQYVDNLLLQRHGSVLEHANITLLIEHVSRSLTHELVRHRAGFAYSQLSQRYVDESDVGVVMPPAIQSSPKPVQEAWISSQLDALEEYRSLLTILEKLPGPAEEEGTAKKKRVREAARSVLPNATETKIVVTANARAWRHFLEMRGAAGADAEIRTLAAHVLVALREVSPGLFEDFVLTEAGSITSALNVVKV